MDLGPMESIAPDPELLAPVPLDQDLADRWGWLDPNDDLRHLGLSARFPVTAATASQLWAALGNPDGGRGDRGGSPRAGRDHAGHRARAHVGRRADRPGRRALRLARQYQGYLARARTVVHRANGATSSTTSHRGPRRVRRSRGRAGRVPRSVPSGRRWPAPAHVVLGPHGADGVRGGGCGRPDRSGITVGVAGEPERQQAGLVHGCLGRSDRGARRAAATTRWSTSPSPTARPRPGSPPTWSAPTPDPASNAASTWGW